MDRIAQLEKAAAELADQSAQQAKLLNKAIAQQSALMAVLQGVLLSTHLESPEFVRTMKIVNKTHTTSARELIKNDEFIQEYEAVLKGLLTQSVWTQLQ